MQETYLSQLWLPILYSVGPIKVSVAVPEAVALVVGAEGPSSSRFGPEVEEDMDWIYNHNGLPPTMFFT